MTRDPASPWCVEVRWQIPAGTCTSAPRRSTAVRKGWAKGTAALPLYLVLFSCLPNISISNISSGSAFCMGNCNLLPCSLTRTPRTPVNRLASRLLKEDVVTQADILQGHHCIHPKCLEASLQRSLTRLGLETLDVLYLHDAAEVQLEVLGRQKFLVRGRCKAGQKSLVRGGAVRRGRVYW